MFTESECHRLRDSLFERKFPVGKFGRVERVFVFLAVEPCSDREIEAKLHYAFSAAIWERAQCEPSQENAIATVKAMLSEAGVDAEKIAIVFHNHLRDEWPLPWDITAKASYNNFPTLVLREAEDGSVSGALMRNPHCRDFRVSFANNFVEPHEVDDLIGDLNDLLAKERYMGLYKDCDISALSLDDAIAQTPETETGQKDVFVYRDSEWLSGIWNNPQKPNAFPLKLMSLADFHGLRVSKTKRNKRVGLDVAKVNQTIPGDYDVLCSALRQLPENDTADKVDYEAIPAIKMLCDWWNSHAPESMRPAAHFRVYIWNSNRQTFIAGDPEEPALMSDVLATIPAYAIFERKGQPTLALNFYRGRKFNEWRDGETLVFYANGELGTSVGMDLNQVDEAFYTFQGLRSIRIDSLI